MIAFLARPSSRERRLLFSPSFRRALGWIRKTNVGCIACDLRDVTEGAELYRGLKRLKLVAEESFI